jgi:uncharacterized protein with HEPN domain
MSEDEQLLRRMAGVCNEILVFAGEEKSTFLMDTKSQAAAAYALIMLGEAIALLSRSVRRAHPDIPWGAFVRNRNHLAHVIVLANPVPIWNTVRHEVPRLRSQLAHLMGEHFST